MEGFRFSDASSAAKKRRSNTSRRPRNDTPLPSDYLDISSLSSTPPSDSNVSKPEDGGFGESDEASNNFSFRGSNEQRNSGVESRRCSEGVLTPANWKNTSNLGQFRGSTDGVGSENKVKKVKLKVGGIIRTINANTASDGASAVGSSSTRSSRFQDSLQKSNEDKMDDNPSFSSNKGIGLRGVLWKDFPRSGISARMPDDNLSSKQTDKYEPVRKSKRVPKKRSLDGVLVDEDEDDDEIRYLEKIKISKITAADYAAEYENEEEGKSRKQRKISKVLKKNVDGLYNTYAGDHSSSRFGKEGKRSKSGRVSEDTDYMEEEEPGSDGEPTAKRKKSRKDLVDLIGDPKKEMMVTTRQRGKDISSSFGASGVEFPNGLPPAPSKKKKEELTEVEQQLKRAEALQRRRMQVEKANRESEAEAIRKILGQDSTRKKREDKLKKRQEELAQGRAANSLVVTADHVRWVMGPSGTVVTFPDELGLPSIFDTKPCSYPPPREKCAGPSCSNPYKYRDSKSKLPLCSLQCYKAIHEKMPTISAC
ncbi:uncharacterized protein LOC126674387 [Mercurialis annua]|uniref:uncharacterized protein LOC126674387 n=1 Tax=Mercurialis annua TaxID=3986 RepID=UPI0021603B2B|nr:uncharacterized protein LOC126674387 [Mercurialis annua]